ncbi:MULTISPECIES: hypothetical protein [Paraburkholderia]|uniref:Uncharacterized protein n=1 Tax=Paraburkholderia madseniana TaxID=2599607 RepID=A0AAP5BMH3_9BURK|nr:MULTISPECIES: hypothetical protein [Paraburkholderia]MCX4151509.1 hypothetical protein [Paraburkholderia madseniana]MDN7154440.1 hypothetical protein [Paraburkholderia sp. WS6]MDQ6413322.1 hypothetical protein [Paraburkholderia madseniana]
MSAYPELLDCASVLNAEGIATVVPEPEDEVVQQLSLFEFETFKRRVSFAHLRKIRDPRTYGVLAVNVDRHGILNYVGPNTFAEIAVAFAQSKKIFLLQNVPEAYHDELSAWRATPLLGRLDRLIATFREDCMVEDPQARLFD